MARLFFLLSGEHSTLPFSEVKAILDAEGHQFRVLSQLRQVMRVEASLQSVDCLARRAALTRVCCAEILCVGASASQIFAKLKSAPVRNWVKKGETFVVRLRRIGESAPDLDVMNMEQEIGAILLDEVPGAKVKLIAPDRTFFGVITEDTFVFGVKLAEIHPKPFVDRRPRKRPFFHPSSMPAKLARCMVNLARPVRGDIVLDPFCGTGAFLIEAGLISCRVVGFDVQKRMVGGSLRNLRHYKVKPEGVLRADARYPPIREVDCLVTDPPYGRASTTRGREVREIIKNLFSTAKGYIPRGRRMCIASPATAHVTEIGEAAGFKTLESHFVYVHRSLTREIVVLERV